MHREILQGAKLVLLPTGHVRKGAMQNGRGHIVRLNIENYQRLLATETDLGKRETITRLVAGQEAKLQQRERKERGD